MSLTTCYECNSQVSSSARTCPRCGYANPGERPLSQAEIDTFIAKQKAENEARAREHEREAAASRVAAALANEREARRTVFLCIVGALILLLIPVLATLDLVPQLAQAVIASVIGCLALKVLFDTELDSTVIFWGVLAGIGAVYLAQSCRSSIATILLSFGAAGILLGWRAARTGW